jgi:hypothetical protein
MCSGRLRGGSLPSTNILRMIFLQEMAKQLPWNDILTKKQGGGGGVLEFYFKFSRAYEVTGK